MRLSNLQKYILLECYSKKKGRLFKKNLAKFYNKKKKKPSDKDVQNIITKSVERLIDKELMEGYGVRTPHRWYITEIKLMPKGRKVAKKLMGEQQTLPLKLKTKSVKCKTTAKSAKLKT